MKSIELTSEENRTACCPQHEIVITGQGLTVDDVVAVARFGAPVKISEDGAILERVRASSDYIGKAVAKGQPLYGVTTGFGGMADQIISQDMAASLQENAIYFLNSGAGKWLPRHCVRAAMLLRANSHLKGVSGIRLDFIRRIAVFLNNNVTPCVREFGSIGASGDLVPLAQMTGAILGKDPTFKVDFDGQEMDAPSAVERLGLGPLDLAPKEGLAMVNGTAFMTGIATICLQKARMLLALSMGAHALHIQALKGSNQSFHPFIHSHKSHPGQKWVATRMLELLKGSDLIRDELSGRAPHQEGTLIQDRYSLRCLAQYTGPIVEGLCNIERQITVESNSATDNPLIDTETGCDYHGGNFLGQYIGIAMDQLRYYVGLLAKHLDSQIALLVSPEFNNGLPASLVGNPQRQVNMGLKGLQITGNSIMPLLSFFGNSLVDRFPPHAEQFNQNISSMGFGSATLALQSMETFERYMAIALIFGVQAVDMRAFSETKHFRAEELISAATRPLYQAVLAATGYTPSPERPFIRNDNEQSLDVYLDKIFHNIAGYGDIPRAIEPHCPSLAIMEPDLH